MGPKSFVTVPLGPATDKASPHRNIPFKIILLFRSVVVKALRYKPEGRGSDTR
jgi:hypothetical protein